MPVRLLAAVLAAAAALATACTTPTVAGPPGAATVAEVIDGDTVIVRIGGRREHVRLLGIDTPETVDPRKPVQCFGREASRRTKELLPPGTAVRLERDIEARDVYHRLLAYVRRADGTFVNLALLEEGFARVLTIPPNGAYTASFVAAARGAAEARRGMWGACPVGSGP